MNSDKKINMRYLILLTFFLFSIIAKANENNFFNEAKDLFEKENYEESKFLFHKNIVYNPKDSASYLYLAKIFNIEETIIFFRKNFERFFKYLFLKKR